MSKPHTIKSKSGELINVQLTHKRAIKFFCYECMGWQKQLVRTCTATTCPLFPFRPLRENVGKVAKNGPNLSQVESSLVGAYPGMGSHKIAP